MKPREDKTRYLRNLLLVIGICIATGIGGLFVIGYLTSRPIDPATLRQQQADFDHLTKSFELPGRQPIYQSSSPLCDRQQSGEEDSPLIRCTLSSTFVYKLDGNYRGNGKEIFAYLKTKGFDFKEDDKYKAKTAATLNNRSYADNLSNTEPIIVDLYNTTGDTRVRVSLGDKGRTIPYFDTPEVNLLDDQQLIVDLNFLKP